MLVIARPRTEPVIIIPDADGTLESAEESTCSEKLSVVSDMIRHGELSNSLDMSGSISARIRRRQKMPVIPVCECFHCCFYTVNCDIGGRMKSLQTTVRKHGVEHFFTYVTLSGPSHLQNAMLHLCTFPAQTLTIAELFNIHHIRRELGSWIVWSVHK